MRKKLFFNFIFSVLSIAAAAQEPEEMVTERCGTPPGISPWLREWKAHPEAFAARSSDTLYAGVQIHLLARNDGTGRMSPQRLLDAFCRLNLDFAASDVRFFFKNDWNLINNTAWHSHTALPAGIEMMLTNDVPGAQNTYFVSNPAGNCGYNLPYASVAVRHSCAEPDEHVWAHEIGHALSLQHTFIGWENTVYNFNAPTPETVLYDYTYFHDTLDTGPAPLDTALVERVDGSNCGIAADLFCDTKPDYFSTAWNCDAQGQSLATLKDQTGATFKADGTLFMSYALDVCTNRFSDEEISALRANLLTEKAAWLSPGPPAPDVAGAPGLLSPVGGVPEPASGVALHWTAAPGATHYLVQVSRFSTFLFNAVDVAVSDTSFTTPAIAPDFTYYWRVRPFNYWDICTEFTESESFMALSASSADAGPAGGSLRCYPTRLSSGQPLTIELPGGWQGQAAQCRVFDTAGRLCWQSEQTPAGDKVFVKIPLENWPAGVYRLVWTNRSGHGTATFVWENF